MFLGVLRLAGCSGQALPSPTLEPLGQVQTTLASSPAPMPTAMPAPTPTAPPTFAELGAMYLTVATTRNRANDVAHKAYLKAPNTLKYWRIYGAAIAVADLAFLKSIQVIAWWGDTVTIERRLFTCNNVQYVDDRAVATATSLYQASVLLTKAVNQSASCSAISNELRLTLGLAPVPIK
jgi:hypothetical protein